MGNVNLEDFRTSMNMLAQAWTAQANREVVANPIGGMRAYRMREFLRMNPSDFSVSKVEEDPNGFIDVVYKTFSIMGLTSREKVELIAY